MSNYYQVLFVVPNGASSQSNREAIARVLVDNGGGETLENELLTFEYAQQLALEADNTVEVAKLLSIAATSVQYAAFLATFETLNESLVGDDKISWYSVANANFETYTQGCLIDSNRPSVGAEIGNPFNYNDVKADLGLVDLWIEF